MLYYMLIKYVIYWRNYYEKEIIGSVGVVGYDGSLPDGVQRQFSC